MDRQDVFEVLAEPISQELLGSSIPARLAYVGIDGAPRAIPIAFVWTGEHVVMATVPKSAKVRALRHNPSVAITIDTQDQWPPRALLIRGAARVELVDGVPDAYVEAARKVTPAEHFAGWEQGVRALYDQMVLVTVEPDWAKLLDFETTIPTAVEDLLRARQGAPTIGAVDTPTVWHNPRCSKSRGALALLADRGIEPDLVRYLDDAPDRAALEDVLRKLGTDDPRAIMRTGEARYRELGLDGADRDALLDALVAEPALIERPIVVVGDRAVVARPPERLLELLDEG